MFAFIVLLAVVLIAASILLWAPVRKIRRLRSTPYQQIALLSAYAQAKVVGYAGGSTLHSPFTSAPCVLWQVEVQEYQHHGRGGSWKTIHKQHSPEPVAIDDGTGRVWIDPEGVELNLGDDLRLGRRLFPHSEANMEAVLTQLGIAVRRWHGFRRPLRVYERRIGVGERVFALGEARQAAGRWVLSALPSAPHLLADRSEDDLRTDLYRQVWGALAFTLIAAAIIGVGMAKAAG